MMKTTIQEFDQQIFSATTLTIVIHLWQVSLQRTLPLT